MKNVPIQLLTTCGSLFALTACNYAIEINAGTRQGQGCFPNGDGSEIQCTVQRPESLKLLSQIDIATVSQTIFRPDVTAIGEELYLAYNSNPSGPMLQRMDRNLNKLDEPISLETATEKTTDIRVGSANGQFWMGFESALNPEIDCNQHFLHAASYTSAPLHLSQSAQRIAKGCALNRKFIENPTGLTKNPEVVDDPTPFYHQGSHYLLTRAWGTTSRIHHLRKLNVDLSVSEDILLDTSTIIPGRQMSQSALLHIGGKPFLVAGFASGAWVPPNTSDLYILQLSDDLRSFVGPVVRLPVTNTTFPTRVTRARHVNGTLIINFVDAYVGSTGFKINEYLGLFDVASDFSLLSQIQTQDHEVMDNHSSFEILADRLYLFQQKEEGKLSAKIFQLK